MLLVLAVFGLSYLRHSYIINFNCSGNPQVVRIGSVQDIHKLESIQQAKNTVPFHRRLYSTFWFWILFFILHSAVFLVYMPGKRALLTHVVLFLSLSALSAMILGINVYWVDRNELYNFASRLKNFLLSPVYMFAAVIFVKYIPGKENTA